MNTPSVASVRALFFDADDDALRGLTERFADDGRAGVVAAREGARRRLDRIDAERRRLVALEAAEHRLVPQGATLVAGLDEVGRGALAGPVTAAACVLPAGLRLTRLDDSKRLTPDMRIVLDAEIRAAAIAVSVAHVPAPDIDAIGIAGATARAMRSALADLGVQIDHALVDGLPVELGVASTAVVGGDATVRAIAAASIIAKVARDAIMTELGAEYDGYGLAVNKGYGTAEHLAAIAARGPCPVHRLSFAPCGQQQLF